MVTGNNKILMQGIALLMVLLMSAPNLWADVRASLDRNNIYDGDTITLTIEANGKDMGTEPDLSVLEKDFTVLGKSSSRRLQFINGKRSDQHQWQIELDPLRLGVLTIPAIPLGNSATSPLTLKVSEQPVIEDAGTDQPVFIKAEIDDAGSSPFVQQQIHYTVRLYFRVPLVQGGFSNLELTDALVERLDEDKQYTTTVNGTRYQILERHYAIFPEKSGPLEIPTVTFTGRVASESGRRSGSRQMDSMMEQFFGSSNPMGMGQRIRVRSQPLSLDVKPRPANYRAENWLPSAELVLEDSWEEGPPEFHVGEPVTRTIVLRAKGLESSHLPDISIPETENMRLYPEQAATENRTDGKWVYGTRTQTIAYVPSRPGRISLPEIRIDWWDTTQQQPRSTVLPAWEINILPAAGSVDEHVAPAPQNEVSVQQDEKKTRATDIDTNASFIREAIKSRRLWLTVALFTLLAAMLLLYRKRLQPKMRARPAANHARRKLQKACEQNDLQATTSALLDWAVSEWPDQPPRTLGALARCVDKGVDEIQDLDKALYGEGNSPWSGQALWAIFKQGLHNGKAKNTSPIVETLSPLYPQKL